MKLYSYAVIGSLVFSSFCNAGKPDITQDNVQKKYEHKRIKELKASAESFFTEDKVSFTKSYNTRKIAILVSRKQKASKQLMPAPYGSNHSPSKTVR